MSRNRRIIYDNDATLVEETVTPKEEFSVKRNAKNSPIINKEIQVMDVLDSFAGYLVPRLEIESEEEPGTCSICGGLTSKKLRKICFNCMQKYKDELYSGFKNAINQKEDSFRL